jgi:uncharacterized phage-associated protein
MLTATQIADWIVRFRADAAAPVDPMSLQKLLFYVQAFRLARYGEPLFAEKFKAWTDGPVVPQVWHRYNQDNSTLVILPAGDNEVPQLDPEIEAGLRDTVGFFSRMTAFALSEATHNEDPWIDGRSGLAAHERSDSLIPADKIRTYYAGLLWDGEEALSRRELLNEIPEPRIGSFYRAGICIRGMRRHPFYTPRWADVLSREVLPEPKLPKKLFAPVKRRDFVSARDL